MDGQFGEQKVHAIDRNHLVSDDAYYLQTATQFTGSTPEFSTSAGRLDKKMGKPMNYQSHGKNNNKHVEIRVSGHTV